MLTISGERWSCPTYDGVQLGAGRWERQTVRFRLVSGGYARKGRLYRTYDPAALARAYRYREWRATGLNYEPRYRWEARGSNPEDEITRWGG